MKSKTDRDSGTVPGFPFLVLCLSVLAAMPQTARAQKPDRALVEAGKFAEIYAPPAGTSERWAVNGHTFIWGPDQQWHVFGTTYPVPPDGKRASGTHWLHATAAKLTQNPLWNQEDFVVPTDGGKDGEPLFRAPHVIRNGSMYYMFVCVADTRGHQSEIRLLISKELWHWERSPASPLLVDGVGAQDPDVVRLGGQWVMYYSSMSSTNGGNHIVASVTSKDLSHWANRTVVFTHPGRGTSGEPTESPFVVRRGKSYYLFICDGATTTVYLSSDAFHWDSKDFVGRIQALAAEVVRDRDGFWFISHAGSERGGLSLARLIWHDGLDGADSSLKPGD